MNLVNPNLHLALQILHFLVQHQVRHVCIAPGSRSAPFALALPYLPKLTVHTHFDERALAFLALGIAKATAQMVVIITTSGSAVANLFPAIMEASTTNIPLIIITADRPNELLACGANQTCTQDHIFGTYANFLHLRALSSNNTVEVILNRLTTALAHTTQDQLPLHLNVEMREPLYNDIPLTEAELTTLFTPYQAYCTQLYPQQNRIPALTLQHNTLVVVGALPYNIATELTSTITKYQLPAILDIQAPRETNYGLWLYNPHTKQHLLDTTDTILVFGGRFVSKAVWQFLSDFKKQLIFINAYPTNLNAVNAKAQYLVTPLSGMKQLLTMVHHDALPPVIKHSIQDTELNEITAITSLAHANCQALFLGNSMTVRIADLVLTPHNKDVYTNRGVSGIDGLIATAAGIALTKSVVAVLGDTSALYDLSSIALLRTIPFKLVIINNNGGNIFSKFPIDNEQVKQQYFLNPQNCSFSHIAQMFNIPYYNPQSLEHYQQLLTSDNKSAMLIELTLPQGEGYQLYTQLFHALTVS